VSGLRPVTRRRSGPLATFGRWLRARRRIKRWLNPSGAQATSYCRWNLRFVPRRLPKLRTAVRDAKKAGCAYVVLDGTLIPVDRVAADRPFYSGKHRKHGMNLQVIASPDGDILWVSGVLPGSVHDKKAEWIWGVLAELEAADLVTLADKGYQGSTYAKIPYKCALRFEALADLVAGCGPAVLRPWRPPGARLAWFRRAGGLGGRRADVPEPAADAGRGEPPGLGGLLPGQAQVIIQRPRGGMSAISRSSSRSGRLALRSSCA
jgi:hypothetical protein